MPARVHTLGLRVHEDAGPPSRPEDRRCVSIRARRYDAVIHAVTLTLRPRFGLSGSDDAMVATASEADSLSLNSFAPAWASAFWAETPTAAAIPATGLDPVIAESASISTSS